MSRPTKSRKVCCMPRTEGFVPIGERTGRQVILTVDEYETVRLIDKEGLSQEECGEHMQIARTTVQQIYTSAREKIATALVDGLGIKIEGGAFRLCENRRENGDSGRCTRENCTCGHYRGREITDEDNRSL